MKQSDYNKQKGQIERILLEHFPQEPYPIQLNIAHLLYETLENEKIKLAIIQSPTGTGKTYSLLVPLIVWLTKNKTKLKIDEKEGQKKSTVPSWLKKPSEQKVEKLFSQKKRRIDGAININDAQNELKRLRLKYGTTSKQKTGSKQRQQQDIEVQSEDEGNNNGLKKRYQQRLDLMVQKQLKVQDQTVLPKIIFISRTHSQLAQVIQSIKKILIPFPTQQLKYLQVASKEHMCINPAINTNKSNISQRCQYVLDHSKCDFFHNLTIRQFYNTNIEDATQLGDAHQLCPYYATRNLIEECDLICLPYASILNTEIRNRIGINLHNSIVVFDEGHNVMDQERQLHSPQVAIEDMVALAQQLDEYAKKYYERLKIANHKLLLHFLEIVRSFVGTMERYRVQRAKEIQGKKYLNVNYLQFVSEMSIKEMKIFKIVKYMQLNNIDQKLAYFNLGPSVNTDKSKGKVKNIQESKISVGKINNIIKFLLQFARLDERRQVLLLKWNEDKKGSIKILCLQSEQLQKIIGKSRLTVVAGGTMQPLDDFTPLLERLKHKVLVKKYPHIIKKQQCSVSILKKIGNKEIIFNHQTTNNQKYMEQLKEICLKVVTKIIGLTEKGGGIVIFIQNYRLIPFFKNVFKQKQFYPRILFDGKDPNQDTPKKDIFETYKSLVQKDTEKNHILFSVMGGKLSQGINFSDRLARSLIVFGLPYANIYAPEVIQTILYNERNKRSAKKQYLQSLCMRTLNQTIGRGVRHIKDYVNIYLVDARFDGIKHKLSEWMKDRVKVYNDIEDL